ncbi:Uncharacterized protein Adt_27228 [Abeliophyllum distichum]|uniref:Uncharacterized protein n=1 Tax=Abeliophyllum distichum TaxID=126358 RepID=A0ABD1RT74_9LAMI
MFTIPHYDVLVVRIVVARNRFRKKLVDNGSSAIVIFWNTYEQMKIETLLAHLPESVYDLTDYCVILKEIIRLADTIGEDLLAIHTFMEFLVVDKMSAYHGVLDRPA